MAYASADSDQHVPRRPRQQRGKIKFEAILDTAKSLMIEGGSIGLRIQEISDKSGISIGGIYQYFPSKEAIVRVIADRYFDEVGAMIFAGLEETPRTLQEFEVMFRTVFMEFAQTHLNDRNALGILLAISSELDLMERSFAASFQHSEKVSEVTSDLFPDWDQAEVTQRIYLAMVMARPLVEAALVAPEGDRAGLLDKGVDILIHSFLYSKTGPR
ncbi:TetR/AcrR family transcriptional regulator [Ruegeria meonggei]|uniref:Bacterial regulatory proteins, tetR family n=1 Tax=Ruegeria meonggei TaxID=1446476 RepID=A0A1X7A336_9RHOB|nr:TetR/AcrR family transcriptional regulator [Ruegeria meonggei]SLN68710.1 Bacterial regulatory proteins, tetR family [Ruegeria meonggei]